MVLIIGFSWFKTLCLSECLDIHPGPARCTYMSVYVYVQTDIRIDVYNTIFFMYDYEFMNMNATIPNRSVVD